MASSPFVGLEVKLHLRSQPHAPLVAKILSVNQATNTLTVARTADGHRIDILRTDIQSLSAVAPPATAHQPASSSRPPSTSSPSSSSARPAPAAQSTPGQHPAPARAETSTPSILFNHAHPSSAARASPHPRQAHASSLSSSSSSSTPSSAPPSDPAILSLAKPGSAGNGTHPTATAPASSSSPAPSPRPVHASAAHTPKQTPAKKKKKQQQQQRLDGNPHSRSASPAISSAATGAPAAAAGDNLDEDFDFGAALRQFDKKRIWDEIRSSDHTDPATLLRQAGSAATNSVKEKTAAAAAAPVAEPNAPGKPTYAELEEKVRKLEAELALAKRRNVLLEELAGLGLGGAAGIAASSSSSSAAAAAAVVTPPTPSPAPLVDDRATRVDEQAGRLSADIDALSLGSDKSQAPAAPAKPADTPAAPAAAPAPAPAPADLTFGHILSAPILTLFFPTAAAQHAAIARIEAFYESSSSSQTYLSLEEAERERICRNYQGFNFPVVEGVGQWLAAMWNAVDVADDEARTRWWEPDCSEAEVEVLRFLVDGGVIADDEGWGGEVSAGLADRPIRYAISTVAAKAHTTLAHERLHALYFLCAEYRALVATHWSTLSAPVRRAIEYDLQMRGYSESVFADEFQAYLAEGEGTEREFGNKCAAECRDASRALRQRVDAFWAQVGGQGGVERWEDVKWDVLDRAEKRQRDKKRSEKGAAAAVGSGGKKGKGGGGGGKKAKK
ncbi:uncharacterized protein PFL1_04502 [Pseudozyma flocculosa PF-1]|uniref:DFDF domain-containing protein n=1 Tax=Pseudozyma flocculosa PF-1 TaxID=1277687 RepID=A0A061H826_9BASI|nr:uncharacterized protein PFL1_04502 [Pseudozyma flocculosa PF-1]EPQ28175.1 hypothetical protein PFL1_04502 [Pseudozyma flocculosa PF-1]